jgi:hypothetical protein
MLIKPAVCSCSCAPSLPPSLTHQVADAAVDVQVVTIPGGVLLELSREEFGHMSRHGLSKAHCYQKLESTNSSEEGLRDSG